MVQEEPWASCKGCCEAGRKALPAEAWTLSRLSVLTCHGRVCTSSSKSWPTSQGLAHGRHSRLWGADLAKSGVTGGSVFFDCGPGRRRRGGVGDAGLIRRGPGWQLCLASFPWISLGTLWLSSLLGKPCLGEIRARVVKIEPRLFAAVSTEELFHSTKDRAFHASYWGSGLCGMRGNPAFFPPVAGARSHEGPSNWLWVTAICLADMATHPKVRFRRERGVLTPGRSRVAG